MRTLPYVSGHVCQLLLQVKTIFKEMQEGPKLGLTLEERSSTDIYIMRQQEKLPVYRPLSSELLQAGATLPEVPEVSSQTIDIF